MSWIAERVETWLRKPPPASGEITPEQAENAAENNDGGALPPVLYGVGDIHGMRSELDRLLDMIEADADVVARGATVVFLGDLVNRGPSSRQVLERLIEGPRRSGDRWITLRGNHDQLFVDAVAGKSESAFRELMRKGGVETLASYGVRKKEASLARARRAVPSDHLRFLEDLPFSYTSGDYFFVHAGVDPLRPLDKQSEKAMMTIREPFLRNAHRLPYTVVHGHVPNTRGPVVATKRICVDTGAHTTGVLTAVALCDRHPARFLATFRG